MYDLGINAENFNPRVLYIFKSHINHQSKCTHHAHDFVELKYIFSGSCRYNINNVDYHVKKGDLIICNPGVSHVKLLSPHDELVEFNAGINSIFIKDLPRDFLIREDISPVFTLSRYESEFHRCCCDIIAEQEKGEPGCDVILKTLIMKLIIIFLKDINFVETLAENAPINFEAYDKAYIVSTIISFINENYMKDISLERIARNMFLSPVYISRIFKEETGDSPINYLIKVRLSKAEEMLKSGQMSIKAVARSIGYNDAYYFSKLFKKYYGCPPSSHKVC